MPEHAYLKGFSTLPDLKKISFDQVFEKDHSNSAEIQKEKSKALKDRLCFFEKNVNDQIYDRCKDFILKYYPTSLKSSEYIDIAREVDEDLIIHRQSGDDDWMASGHVCLPSSWDPSEKIGLSFDEMHAPVPMSLKNSSKIVKAIINSGPFERYLWSVVYEKKYDFHPSTNSKKFDKFNPEVYVKIERQITVGFPEENFCLFILRQYLIEEKDIDKRGLIQSIQNMTCEQKKYKGLLNSEELIEYLRN